MANETVSACPMRRVVTEVGDDAWLVTGYANVRAMFNDNRLGRSHPTPDTAPRKSTSVMFGGPVGNFETEWEELEWRRKLLSPFFSPKRIRTLRPRVEALTTQLLDEMVEHGSPVDLQAVLANQLPVLVICELLGVPLKERDKFHVWSDAVLDERDGAKALQAAIEFLEYSKDLIRRKRLDPGDDVFSRLSEVEGMDDDTIARLGVVLLLTGQETTVANIGHGVLKLLENPAQWQMLVNNPELVPGAVEELLRILNTNQFVRYPRSGMTFDGGMISAGELVLLDMGSANHDPEIFPDPDRLDVGRKQGAHLAFGFGPRYCTGAPLARLELQIVLGELVARFPAMRLVAGADTPVTCDGIPTKRLTALSVEW